MKKIILLIIWFTSPLIWSQAEALKTKAEVVTHSNEVMALFGQAKFDEAFNVLRKYYPVSEVDYQNLKVKTTNNLESAQSAYGNITGEVFIKESNLKDVAIQRVYLVKYELILLRFTLVYYNSVNGYVINSFAWDDNFEELFD